MNDNVNYLSPVANLAVEDRSDFIWKCYAHVVGAILAFAAYRGLPVPVRHRREHRGCQWSRTG